MGQKVELSLIPVANVTKTRFIEKTVNGKKWVSYGNNNRYPDYLWWQYTNCPTQQAIIDAKTAFTMGNGINCGKDIVNTAGETLDEVLRKCVFDLHLFGGFAIQVVYGRGGDILEIYWADFAKLRINSQGNKVYWSDSWHGYNFRPIEYDVFNPKMSGKTTQINLLKEYLEEAGYECLITREPGGTVIGEEVRQLILNPEHKEMSPVTEMLLYAASRAQLVHEVIGPALEEGKIVISDRFVDSSIVYQGIARKLGISTVSAVNAPGIGIYRPDGIFFIDLSEAEGLRRKKEQKNLDRMEQEGIDFHHMVSEGYRKVLSGRPEVMKIDGGRSIDTIQKKIRNHVDELLKKKNR